VLQLPLISALLYEHCLRRFTTAASYNMQLS